MKKKAFTLIEVIIAVTIFFFVLVTILSLYTRMTGIKYSLQAKTNLIQDTHNVMEKINLLLKNYTIDYEEYFNRGEVGCVGNGGGLFTWDVGTGGSCTKFTYYGNRNMGDGTDHDASKHELYHCTSAEIDKENDPKWIVSSTNVQLGSGCPQGSQQSFGQYALQFRDVKKDVDNTPSIVGDEDDQDVMRGPVAIKNSTGVQELYLISPDQKQRLMIRRKLVATGDRDGNGIISGDNEKLYTLQILRLRGFDAGNTHNFDIVGNTSGVYDGQIDTWACDASQQFICSGATIGGTYTSYNLPQGLDSEWVNLLDNNLTITNRNVTIFPTKDPYLALAENEVQINPYFTVSLETKLYGKIWYKRLGAVINNFVFSLQTTFSTKEFYTK